MFSSSLTWCLAGGSAIVAASNAEGQLHDLEHEKLRDARGIPIHADDPASTIRLEEPGKFEYNSVANVSTVAQDGSALTTPTKEKSLPTTESENHFVENDETVPVSLLSFLLSVLFISFFVLAYIISDASIQRQCDISSHKPYRSNSSPRW